MKSAGIILIIFCFAGQAQPRWIEYEYRQSNYPEYSHFIGFSSRYFEEGEDLNKVSDEVKNLARTDLSESIFVSLTGQSTLGINTTDGMTSTSFEKSSVTKSSLEAVGLKTETHLDKGQKIAYGFSYVRKKSLAAGYYKRLSAIMKDIKSTLEKSLEIENTEIRYKELTGILQDLHEVTGMQDMLIFLGVTNDAVLMSGDWKNYRYIVKEEFEKIRSDENQSLSQLVNFLLDDMTHELGNTSASFSIRPISYKNSGIPTEFSDYFHQILGRSSSTRFKVLESSDARFKLTGSYWPSGDEVQITLNLYEYDNNEPMVLLYGGSFAIDESEVKKLGLIYEISDEGIDFKKHHEILNSSTVNGGMTAMVTTQKGSESLIFREGEILKLYVNISRPAYLRLLNVWSDGTQLSLLDNYYIDESRLNQQVPMPFEFETACPCGTEYIKLIAQSEPFEKLEVTEIDGFDYITTSVSDVLGDTRGFQKVKAPDEGFYYGESGFSVTTIKRN